MLVLRPARAWRGRDSQRALIAAGFLAYEKEQAQKRKAATQFKDGSAPVPVTLPEPATGEARERAGARMQVGGRTVERAAHVLREGSPVVVIRNRVATIVAPLFLELVGPHLSDTAARGHIRGH